MTIIGIHIRKPLNTLIEKSTIRLKISWLPSRNKLIAPWILGITPTQSTVYNQLKIILVRSLQNFNTNSRLTKITATLSSIVDRCWVSWRGNRCRKITFGWMATVTIQAILAIINLSLTSRDNRIHLRNHWRMNHIQENWVSLVIKTKYKRNWYLVNNHSNYHLLTKET